jgi:AraC family transcriptional regulator of adaptative response / DNA-3-methyladenine glycosylase II
VLTLRLPYRPPLDWPALFGWLRARTLAGISEASGDTYRRTLRLPRGAGIATLAPVNGHIACTLQLESMADLTSAVRQCRRLLDLDADPLSVTEVLGRDRHLATIVSRRPGLRAPGAVDGVELAMQAVLGQQVSLAAARTLATRLVTAHGDVIKIADPSLTHVFPSADRLVDADLSQLGLPGSRQKTVRTLAKALATSNITLDPGADRTEVHRKLLELPGIGEWTAGYIVMRALGDPDTFLGGDLGIRRATERLGLGANPRVINEHASAWSPWRTYATHQLWATLAEP